MAGLMSVVTRYVVVDAGWNLDAVVGQLGSLAGSDVVFRTVPTVRPDLQTPADGIAVEVDAARVREFVGTVLNGDPRATDAEPAAAGAVRTGAPTGVTPTPTAAGTSRAVPPSSRPVIDAGRVTCVD
jgi:hypothetical protein